MGFFSPILLAIALSIDGFGVGLAYGIRKVKLAFLPIILIVLCSAIAMTCSIFAGQMVANFIPQQFAGAIGGVILVVIGLWQLIEGWKNYRFKKLALEGKDNPVLLTINIKFFGLVLQVMREPVKADMDKSGEISYREALLLGVAINIDVIGAGLGAGIAGYSLVLIPTVAIVLFLAICSGLIVGEKYSEGFLEEKGHVLPGLILMLIGLVNIFK